jgi:hypothetical protein
MGSTTQSQAPTIQSQADDVILLLPRSQDNVAFSQAWEEHLYTLSENLKTYFIFAVALSTLGIIQLKQQSYLYKVALLAMLFMACAYLQAYLGVLKQRSAMSFHRNLLSNANTIVSIVLAWVLVVFVQLIMLRATPFLSDGNWGLANLVIPLFTLAHVSSEWYAHRLRIRPESNTKAPATKGEEVKTC